MLVFVLIWVGCLIVNTFLVYKIWCYERPKDKTIGEFFEWTDRNEFDTIIILFGWSPGINIFGIIIFGIMLVVLLLKTKLLQNRDWNQLKIRK